MNILINLHAAMQDVAELGSMQMLTKDVTPTALQEENLNRMRAGISIFIFKKKDGTMRKAIGTLNEHHIVKERQSLAKAHKPAPNNQTFFDLQTLEFRSYNIDSIVALIDF